MIGFTIKKWFFDYWDNFFLFGLINIGFLVLVALPLYGTLPFAETAPIVGLIISSLGMMILFMYTGAVHKIAFLVANYQKPEWKDFFQSLRAMIKPSVIIGALWLFVAITLFFVFPFYLSLESLLGVGALAFLFWMTILWTLASQYFFPVYCQLDQQITKTLKKSFILFFDNGGFSFFMLVFKIIILGLSGFTAFLILGPGSIVLMSEVMVKLRLYKYDYLEENPQVKRSQIPWRVIMMDDDERVGKRTLRGIIFPWKE
jgi:uncharacterized membrane protein YesL